MKSSSKLENEKEGFTATKKERKQSPSFFGDEAHFLGFSCASAIPMANELCVDRFRYHSRSRIFWPSLFSFKFYVLAEFELHILAAALETREARPVVSLGRYVNICMNRSERM